MVPDDQVSYRVWRATSPPHFHGFGGIAGYEYEPSKGKDSTQFVRAGLNRVVGPMNLLKSSPTIFTLWNGREEANLVWVGRTTGGNDDAEVCQSSESPLC